MRKYKVHKFEIYTATAHKNDTEFFKNMYTSIFGKDIVKAILKTYDIKDLDIRVIRKVYTDENNEVHHTRDYVFTGLKDKNTTLTYKSKYIQSKDKLDLSKCYAVDTILMPIYYDYMKNPKKHSIKEWSKKINKIKDDCTDELIWEEIKECCSHSLVDDMFNNPNLLDIIMLEYTADDISKLVGIDIMKNIGATDKNCMYLNFRTCTDGETSVTSRGISVTDTYYDTAFEYITTKVNPAIDKLNIPRYMHQCDAWMNLIRIVREEIYPIKDKLSVEGKLNRGIYVSSLLESKMITDDMKKRILKNIEDTEVYMRNIIDGNQIFN
ncbi:hypothetical protein JDFnp1_60 [Fusobacterium phage JD-Fnp1]|nr:hypothetical protein JDFnp1_60 [Fusobacterium phage JD-Fnp1]